MLCVGFEPTIPASERALECSATVTYRISLNFVVPHSTFPIKLVSVLQFPINGFITCEVKAVRVGSSSLVFINTNSQISEGKFASWSKDLIRSIQPSFVTSWLPVQGVLPTVPDQETEETQPYASKAGASSQVWEQRGKKIQPSWLTTDNLVY
jgi:hypothetical protein